MKKLLPFCAILLIPSVARTQTTWYVPDNFATIQDGINGALDGDTVIVRDGTYIENINFNGKSIYLKSENGPVMTIIDGNQTGSAVTFNGNNILAAATLDGFTVTNGSGTFDVGANYECGGGIYCTASSPVITNNIIRGNVSGFGGGISCRSASAAILVANVITNNTAYAGGGISLAESEVQILRNEISGNLAHTGSGGGIAAASSFAPNISGNVIAGNRAGADGGGISCLETSPNLERNTIVENIAMDEGGGMSFYGGCQPLIADAILWENNASIGKEISIGRNSWYWGYSVVEIRYSDVQGGQASVYVETGNTLYWLAGMISAYPDFLDPLNRDLHLRATSPCIDSGDPNGPNDPDGTRADMGAFYYDRRPTLAITNLVAGQTATIDVSNCTPTKRVYVVWSVAGGGPISTPYGAGYVSKPYTIISMRTDANGNAIQNNQVPAHLAGTNIWFHGADLGSATLLNPLAMTIQ